MLLVYSFASFILSDSCTVLLSLLLGSFLFLGVRSLLELVRFQSRVRRIWLHARKGFNPSPHAPPTPPFVRSSFRLVRLRLGSFCRSTTPHSAEERELWRKRRIRQDGKDFGRSRSAVGLQVDQEEPSFFRQMCCGDWSILAVAIHGQITRTPRHPIQLQQAEDNTAKPYFIGHRLVEATPGPIVEFCTHKLHPCSHHTVPPRRT